MLDTRAFDGWRRLTASILRQAAADDPAALRQVLDVLDDAYAKLPAVVAQLRSDDKIPGPGWQAGYSWAAIAAALGVTRSAAAQRFGSDKITVWLDDLTACPRGCGYRGRADYDRGWKIHLDVECPVPASD